MHQPKEKAVALRRSKEDKHQNSRREDHYPVSLPAINTPITLTKVDCQNLRKHCRALHIIEITRSAPGAEDTRHRPSPETVRPKVGRTAAVMTKDFLPFSPNVVRLPDRYVDTRGPPHRHPRVLFRPEKARYLLRVLDSTYGK